MPISREEFEKEGKEEISWVEKEKRVRKILSEKYKHSFTKERLVFGTKSNGAPVLHEFDLYSEDGSIVGEVKSFSKSHDDASNSLNFDCCLADIYRLGKVKTEKKLFVLTEKEFYEYFKKKADGLVSEVEILYIDVGRGDG